MNRRDFFGRVGVGALAIPVTGPLLGAWHNPPHYETAWKRAKPVETVPTLHCLGPEPSSPASLAIRMLSEDVFIRLAVAVRGNNYSVTNLSKAGESIVVGLTDLVVRQDYLTEQWNTAYEVPRRYLDADAPTFPLAHFRENTDAWACGPVMCVNAAKMTPAREAFAGKRLVGMPYLPEGMTWAGHYLDEATGMMMRALGYYEVVDDWLAIRWDVLCG